MTLLTFITIPILVLIMIPLGRIMQEKDIKQVPRSEIADFSDDFFVGSILS